MTQVALEERIDVPSTDIHLKVFEDGYVSVTQDFDVESYAADVRTNGGFDYPNANAIHLLAEVITDAAYDTPEGEKVEVPDPSTLYLCHHEDGSIGVYHGGSGLGFCSTWHDLLLFAGTVKACLDPQPDVQQYDEVSQ